MSFDWWYKFRLPHAFTWVGELRWQRADGICPQKQVRPTQKLSVWSNGLGRKKCKPPYVRMVYSHFHPLLRKTACSPKAAPKFLLRNPRVLFPAHQYQITGAGWSRLESTICANAIHQKRRYSQLAFHGNGELRQCGRTFKSNAIHKYSVRVWVGVREGRNFIWLQRSARWRRVW